MVVEFKLRGEHLEGSVVSITEGGRAADPICHGCKAELHDAHLVGATFIKGLTKDMTVSDHRDKWINGTVVDIRPPGLMTRQGFVANCEVELVDGNARFSGWPYAAPLLGQTHTWVRVQVPMPAASASSN